MLVVAALIGLGIVFVEADDAVTRVLLSVLVLGAACLFALAAVPARAPVPRWPLLAIAAVLTWVVMWTLEPSDALGQATAMVGLVAVVVSLMRSYTVVRRDDA